MSKALYVTPDHIDNVWADVEEFIKLTDDIDTKASQIYGSLRSGVSQLWMGVNDKDKIEMVVTTSFVNYPDSGKMCRIDTMGGKNLEDWMDYLKDIEEWAKLNGCIAMDIFGRKAWEKLLKPEGYGFDSVLLRKRFEAN